MRCDPSRNPGVGEAWTMAVPAQLPVQFQVAGSRLRHKAGCASRGETEAEIVVVTVYTFYF
jgi:hypothetical protein